MTDKFELKIGDATLEHEGRIHRAMLTVQDVADTYTIPYVQSSHDLEVSAGFRDPSVAAIRLHLSSGKGRPRQAELVPGTAGTTFDALEHGEYTLLASAVAADGREIGLMRCERIGIGTVIGALGDSITEGYYGVVFERSGPLRAGDFPPEAVSRDGRNFPQWGPTTEKHMKTPKCMQSWMTDLNDLLADQFGWPVFIANEGWGGIRTSGYLKRMREDANWRQRMARLHPSLWLVHLGVNDERGKRPPQDVAADLEAMIDLLLERHGARPGNIIVARPCYDYHPKAEPILASYCTVIDEIVERRGLLAGPDFFDAYSRDRASYYGQDTVHPNPEGMRLMARLWAAAITTHRAAWDRRDNEGEA